MNFFEWLKEKRLNRLEADIMALSNRIKFDPRFTIGAEREIDSMTFTRRIEEYLVWSTGSGRLLYEFYKSGASYAAANYFWVKAPIAARRLHAGIPGLISARMPVILFGNGYTTSVTVYGENGKEDKKKSKAARELIEGISEKILLHDRLEEGATKESWGGHVFFKFSHDVSVSEYPIMEVYDIRKAEVVKKRGLTKAIIFKNWYQHKNEKYRLDEIYTTNVDRDACIIYKLFKRAGDGKDVEVPLDSIPHTATLAEDMGLDENNTFTYTGLKGMLAFDKPNKSPSLEFPDSDYGASDYEGAIDSFDALDEAYSKIIHEIRTNATKRYIPEEMIPKIDGEPILDDDFTDNYVKITGDIDQGDNGGIQYSTIPDKTEEHLAKFRTALTTAINKAGLSPFALGITGLESINASADSQQERNKVTIDTRKEKLKKWKPFIEQLLTQAVALNSWLLKNTDVKQEAYTTLDLDYDNSTIKVEFGDYVVADIATRINIWGNAKMQRVATTREAVKQIHPDWNDKEVENEVNLIRFEDGISVDNPDNLPHLDGSEGEDENDV